MGKPECTPSKSFTARALGLLPGHLKLANIFESSPESFKVDARVKRSIA
jgi:hypothetical protein